ncbi:MAG TPA: hypothetical protein PKL31_11590 [Fulvivirga sp.]|nr:hypothetical protein [Fulvivirga sp.]
MSINELVNAYFDGEMNEGERSDFLNRVSQDTELKKEFQFQSEIVEGIKSSRVSQLKARLDNVPVGGGYSFGIGKMAFIGGVIILSGLSYLYISNVNNELPMAEPKAIDDAYDELITQADEAVVSDEKSTLPEVKNTQKTIDSKNKVQAEKNTIASAPQINKPNTVEPLELIEEANDEFDVPESGLNENNASSLSTIDIEVDNSKKKYSFHYQLKEGRLFLYGSFDKGLYEILEFNSPDGKILYLYYKDKYYGLRKNQSEITPLVEITEGSLISKLETARKEIKE